MIELITAVIANAFGRRFAGGLLGQWFGWIGGSQVGRLAQAVVVGGTVATLAPVWWWGLAAVPLSLAGAIWGFPTITRRWPFINLRSNMVPKNWLEVLSLSINGVIACAPLALGAWWISGGWWWLLAAGLVRGPAYWLATFWQPRILMLGLIPGDPPPSAEFYVGGALGLGLFAALWGL